MIEKWKRLGQKVLLDLRIMKVLEIEASSARGVAPHPFMSLTPSIGSMSCPSRRMVKWYSLRQYRHGSDEISLEIPGGMVDPGEEPAVAAARECLEKVAFGQKGWCRSAHFDPILPSFRIICTRLLRTMSPRSANTEHSDRRDRARPI